MEVRYSKITSDALKEYCEENLRHEKNAEHYKAEFIFRVTWYIVSFIAFMLLMLFCFKRYNIDAHIEEALSKSDMAMVFYMLIEVIIFCLFMAVASKLLNFCISLFPINRKIAKDWKIRRYLECHYGNVLRMQDILQRKNVEDVKIDDFIAATVRYTEDDKSKKEICISLGSDQPVENTHEDLDFSKVDKAINDYLHGNGYPSVSINT